jgi:hypothetical protein
VCVRIDEYTSSPEAILHSPVCRVHDERLLWRKIGLGFIAVVFAMTLPEDWRRAILERRKEIDSILPETIQSEGVSCLVFREHKSIHVEFIHANHEGFASPRCRRRLPATSRSKRKCINGPMDVVVANPKRRSELRQDRHTSNPAAKPEKELPKYPL